MRRLAIAIIILTLMIPTAVWALGSDHSKQPVNNDKWSKGLAELVNAENRVHGYFVNWEDVFFLKGDTAAFNNFLAKYSELPDTQLQVVIHPGKLAVHSPWDKQPRDITADWQIYTSPFSKDQVHATGITPGPFITRVDVWLGGSVNLDELQVPEKVSVTSGGEIEAFVKKHKQTR